MTTPKAEKNGSPSQGQGQTRPAQSFRLRWGWLLLLGFLAAGAYVIFTRPGIAPQHGGKRGANARGALPVTAAAAKRGDISVYLDALGSVVPLNTVTVKTRVDGQLMKVLFREGQRVGKGALLAEIDPRPYQVQLTQAEGQMARDQALLANARVDLERYRTLAAQDSIARQQLDTQAALVRQYEGAVKVDRGQIDSARLQLVYTRITAPVSGRLGLRQVDPGNIVHAADQNGLVVITQLQPVTVVFAIPEHSLPAVMQKLRAGDKLAVDVYNQDGKVRLASGRLLAVDNQIDPSTGTVKLKAQFANDGDRLFPNQFVNVRMLLEVRRGATVIPTAAIQQGSRGTFVYLVKPDRTVTVRPIEPGPTQGDSAAVDAGLTPGEWVVTDGGDKLREGSRVELVTKNGPPPGNGAQRQHGAGRHRSGTGADSAATGN